MASPNRRFAILILSAIASLVLAGAASAADPQPYDEITTKEGDVSVTRVYDANAKLSEIRNVTKEGDTEVTRTTNPKGDLMEIKRITDRKVEGEGITIERTTETKRYDAGKRPPWETVTQVDMIGIVNWEEVIKSSKTETKTWTKTKPRKLLTWVRQTATLVSVENGVMTWEEVRLTKTKDGVKREVRDPRTQQWVEQKKDDGTKVSRGPSEDFDREFTRGPIVGENARVASTLSTDQIEALPVRTPNFAAYLDGGFTAQRLPVDSGNLGVINVGNEERTLISMPTVLYAGLVDGGFSIGNIKLSNLWDLQVKFDLGYANGSDDNTRIAEAEYNVVNGLTFWGRSDSDSPGISSNGAGAWGRNDTDFQSIDAAALVKMGGPCSLGDDEGFTLIDGERFLAPGFDTPRIYFEFGPSYRYTDIDTSQRFRMTNEDPFFLDFDISSDTDIEIMDYRVGAYIGAAYTLPIPGTKNFAFSFGGGSFLGYRDSDVDATQRNRCHVVTQSSEGENVCDPTIRDLEFKENLDDSGFDWGLSGMGRLDYRVEQFLGGKLTVGLVYDVDYAGHTQFDAPKNQQNEGTLDLDWERTVSHSVTAQLRYAF